MHCAQSEHPYSYIYAECIVHRENIHILICTLNVRETSDDWQTGIFNISCTSRGLMHEQWTKNDTRIIVPFNFVPFNFVMKSSMSWHCFESKRTDMHVSEFLNAKCLVEVTHP